MSEQNQINHLKQHTAGPRKVGKGGSSCSHQTRHSVCHSRWPSCWRSTVSLPPPCHREVCLCWHHSSLWAPYGAVPLGGKVNKVSEGVGGWLDCTHGTCTFTQHTQTHTDRHTPLLSLLFCNFLPSFNTFAVTVLFCCSKCLIFPSAHTHIHTHNTPDKCVHNWDQSLVPCLGFQELGQLTVCGHPCLVGLCHLLNLPCQETILYKQSKK